MMRSMFAAITGLKVHQVMLDVTANDISNVNTIAYKASRTTFQDSLTQVQRGAVGPSTTQGGANPVQIGLGAQLGSIDNLMGGGALQVTGNQLDVAIQGEGWFRIGAGTPPAVPTVFEYTRAGNFSMSSEGFLTTQSGQYVLGYAVDAGGNAAAPEIAIQVPDGATGFAIDQSGGVSYVDPVTQTRVTPFRLTLANFSNNAGLERIGANQWKTSANSGDKIVNTPGQGGLGKTTAGAIEMSNVDLSQTFTSMITAQRGFQANSRVISTADEMLQDLVNLKR